MESWLGSRSSQSDLVAHKLGAVAWNVDSIKVYILQIRKVDLYLNGVGFLGTNLISKAQEGLDDHR